MRKNHAFRPALDGRLEDRLVLSGANFARAAYVARMGAIASRQAPAPTFARMGAIAPQRVAADQAARTGPITAQQTSLERATQFTTQRYYNITIRIHNAVEDYADSDGSQKDFNRLLNRIYNQVRFIPYAVQDGLVSALRTDLEGAAPADSQAIYSIVRGDILDFIDFETSAGAMTIVKSKGPSYWTDSEILGLGTGTLT
ncbi:MAG: hypothetical protein U0790_17465 [Isosphaeraceae bacterium]